MIDFAISSVHQNSLNIYFNYFAMDFNWNDITEKCQIFIEYYSKLIKGNIVEQQKNIIKEVNNLNVFYNIILMSK